MSNLISLNPGNGDLSELDKHFICLALVRLWGNKCSSFILLFIIFFVPSGNGHY
jgi:hypothetical protein